MRQGIRGGAAVVDPARRRQPEIPGLAEYHRDLLAGFGEETTVDTPLPEHALSHIDLVDLLLARRPEGATARPDLVLLAYALPDLHPFDTTSAYLNWRLGNAAASFAVSEQGLLAPFSALRIAGAYTRAGLCHRVTLAVLEQTTLVNGDPLVADSGLVDSGALLFFDAKDSAPGLAVSEIHTRQPAEDCAAVINRATSGATALVLGPWPGHPPAVPDTVDVRRTPAGSYCTSVWLALAQHHAEWARRYHTVILHDTDPRSGRCGSLVLRRTENHCRTSRSP